MNTPTEELINSPFRQRLGAKRRRLVQLLAGLTPTEIVVSVYDDANTLQSGAQTGVPAVTPAGIVTPLLHPAALGWYRVDVAFKSGDEEYIEYFRLEVY